MWACVGHWSLERDVAVALQEMCEGREGNRVYFTCGMGVGRFAAALLWAHVWVCGMSSPCVQRGLIRT